MSMAVAPNPLTIVQATGMVLDAQKRINEILGQVRAETGLEITVETFTLQAYGAYAVDAVTLRARITP